MKRTAGPNAPIPIVSAIAGVFFAACTWLHGTAPDGSAKQYEPIVIDNFQKWDIDEITQPILLSGWSVKTTYHTIIAADNTVWIARADELREATSEHARNDYAVANMYLGNYDEAITTLRKLDDDTGDKDYFVAANLGTACELAGNFPEAIKWISEGMTRNEDSHLGTEWLHKAILQAKLDGEDSVFGLSNPLNFDEALPAFTFFEKTYTLTDVFHAITYQTAERAAFVKPKDALMADLFATAGNITARTRALEPAIDFFELASEYGHPRALEIEGWIPHAREKIEIANRTRLTKRIALWTTIAITTFLLAILGAWDYRRRKRKQTDSAISATHETSSNA